jgi:3-hydroxyacyl-CoA dehydrogenase
MKYADQVGLESVLADLREFEKEDDYFWKPANLIQKLVANKANFASLN